MTEEQAKVYRNPNNDPRGRWRSVPMTAQAGHATAEQFYEVETPSGALHRPPEGRCWGVSRSTYEKLLSEGRIYFGKDRKGQPNIIRYLSEVPGLTPWTWWPSSEVGHTDEAKKETNKLFNEELSFGTPKPERLLERILHIATNPDDLILDSFVGSGTTSAVAHKMGRRWIGIEMGEHARTHCVPRLTKVVEGEQGGISQAVGWQGGGGFRFMQLGEPVFDEQGRISPDVRFPTLAAYLWFSQTRRPWQGGTEADGCPSPPRVCATPLLGVHDGTAIVLLYNGILGDRRPQGGNVLTHAVWQDLKALLPEHTGPWRIYGEASRITPAMLKRLNLEFHQIPYDIRMR